jgi:non-heme chloroperoxidase
MLPLCESHRIRCVAVDRRGFGKSDWTGTGASNATDVTYETFAKDTVHVLQEVGLKKFVFVGASMGGGEMLLAYFGSEWVRERCQVCALRGRECPHSRSMAILNNLSSL